MINDPRIRLLLDAQGSDGGWGFFSGKRSWLEPTVWAMLALGNNSDSKSAVLRGWQLVRGWQAADGSWQANSLVKEPHWTTALAVLLHAVHGGKDEAMRRGIDWLLGVSGSENGLTFRITHFLKPDVVEFDPSLRGWPWRPDCTSWVEPTAHALVALRRVQALSFSGRIQERIDQGEKMLLDRRCRDWGWNYGNRRVFGDDLPSYPETTGIALYGLAGNPRLDIRDSLALARRSLAETRSPLAVAWLSMALRSHGVPVQLPAEPSAPSDILVTALEAVAISGALA